MDNEDIYFYPIICCVSCTNITKDWEWIESPVDGEIYGVCKKCKEVKKMERRTYQLIAVRYKKTDDIGFTRTEFPLFQEKEAKEFFDKKVNEGYTVTKEIITVS